VVASLNGPKTVLHLKLQFNGKYANLMILANHVPIFVVENVGHVIYPITIFFFVCIEDSEDKVTEEEN
jgi:hypothetical protein